MNIEESDYMTDVTIRGIDDDVYSLFSAEARKRGISIGELVTQVMKALLEESSNEGYVIENLKELSVSRKELESIDGPVAFINIKTLIIEDDITWDIFKTSIDEIRKVYTISIPKTLTKFQVLTKCRHVTKIIERN